MRLQTQDNVARRPLRYKRSPNPQQSTKESMKNLFIPPIGTEITLAEDWTFELWNESRNDTLVEVMGIQWPEADYYGKRKQHHTVTIPKGETLKIDRIYIRKGKDDFDSVTFMWKGKQRPAYVEQFYSRSYKMPARIVRFWAKLDDVNKILIDS